MFIHSRRHALPNRQLVLLNITYYRPDYQSILQEFMLQTEDEVPTLPRIHRFLNYWHHNIEAVIKEISVSHGNGVIANWRHELQ